MYPVLGGDDRALAVAYEVTSGGSATHDALVAPRELPGLILHDYYAQLLSWDFLSASDANAHTPVTRAQFMSAMPRLMPSAGPADILDAFEALKVDDVVTFISVLSWYADRDFGRPLATLLDLAA